MRTMPVPLEVGRAVCADPEHLPLVDAAAAKPGGPAAQEMKARLCRHCPVNQTCGAWAMTHAEAGIWGGTSPGWRGKRGAPRGLTPVQHTRTEGVPAEPWRRRQPKPSNRKTEANALRLAELGVTGAQVKRWAHEQGLVRTISGRVALATIEAYAAAHQDT